MMVDPDKMAVLLQPQHGFSRECVVDDDYLVESLQVIRLWIEGCVIISEGKRLRPGILKECHCPGCISVKVVVVNQKHFHGRRI